MGSLGNFEDVRELDLTEEVSDMLHYYAYHLPWKGGFFTEDLKRIRNWIVNDCIRENLEIELKNMNIRPVIDPKREREEILFDKKQKPKKKDSEIKVEDIVKLFKDVEAFDPVRGVMPGKHPGRPQPYAIIEGIPLIRRIHWDNIRLYDQEWENLFHYCSKSGINPDMIIPKWLKVYLEEKLKDKDFKRIKSIRWAIKEAKAIREETERKEDLPDWDLDKI